MESSRVEWIPLRIDCYDYEITCGANKDFIICFCANVFLSVINSRLEAYHLQNNVQLQAPNFKLCGKTERAMQIQIHKNALALPK